MSGIMEAKNLTAVTDANRDAWNESAKYHRLSASWPWLWDNVTRPDFCCLDETVTALLRAEGIAGSDAVQIGCNNGRESLSLFALGARSVVGVDQSAAFLEQARELAARSPHDPEFVEADVHRLPPSLAGRFDVAFITIGVLNWMPDLARFFAAVAATLKPGGRLIVYETHPFLELFEPHGENPFEIVHSYFRAEPMIEDTPIVYEGPVAEKITPSYWHIHTMGAIVTGLIGAGLTIRHLREYPHSNREAVFDQYMERGVALPMCFTLVARKD
jgi:SAM-dependent methyltransferase